MIRFEGPAMLRTALAATTLLFAAPVAAQETDELTVLLEWFVNPDHAPLVVADQLGYFADEGLEVTLIPPTDPSAPPRLVAARQADVAIHYQPNLYLDHQAALPLKWFGTLVETPLNTVTVLKDGPVQTLADLKGRRIGYSVAGFEDGLLLRMLDSVGLTRDDVEMINVNFALTTSLMTGQVDASVGAYRNFELTQIRLAGGEGRAFFVEEHGVPAYDELIYVTHDDLIGDDRLPRFLSAVERATLYLTNHPDEAFDLYTQAYPDLDDELNRQAWIDTLPRFAKRPAALDRGRYERFGAFMATSGLIDAAPDVDDIAAVVR